MKTSEDKLNEALRAALKRKFDNFEDAPNPSAFEKIRGSLKPGKQWKYLFFTLLFVGIAIVGVMTDQHYRKNSMAAATVAKTAAAKTSVAKTEVIKTATAKTAVAKMAVVKQVASKNYKLTNRQIQQSEPLLIGQKLPNESLTAVSEHNSWIKTNFEPENLSADASVSDAPFLDSKYNSNIEKSIGEDITTQHETELPGENAVKFVDNTLDIQPAKFTSVHASLPGINVSKSEIKPITKNGLGNFSLLINAAILQSYQILTVPSGSQRFQNFDFPSAFSIQSLGYKVSIGAEKKGFQFMLHYSWFHQSYSYEIAGNDYIVETVDKDNFKVIRQGTRVSQDNTFRLLGVGVNKEVTWGNANVGKYYASAGLQYSYGLIRRQSIGWVNAGIGKQFPISKSRSLYIGPYAEFSPVKFSGSGDPFFYQPYRIGISAGLRLNR